MLSSNSAILSGIFGISCFYYLKGHRLYIGPDCQGQPIFLHRLYDPTFIPLFILRSDRESNQLRNEDHHF